MTEKRIKKEIEVPVSVTIIKDMLKEEGFKTFLVGGAVRDSLTGDKIKDFDLATDATPDKTKDCLSKYKHFNILEIGEQFGIINVVSFDGEFEIATFREEEGYSDGRRPDEVKFSTIEKDVLRRDLTMNALFYDLETKEIVDLVGGVQDLEDKVVATVGNAEDRFEEDRLRVLRAIRFACRFDAELDIDVDESISENNSLELVSKERIKDEFIKCLKTTKFVSKLNDLLEEFDLIDQIFPGLYFEELPVTASRNLVVSLAFSLLDNDVNKLAKSLNKLTYKTKDINKICFLIKSVTLDERNALSLKKEMAKSKVSFFEFCEFHTLLKSNNHVEHIVDIDLLNAFLKFEPSVTGESLLSEGFSPGPVIGKEIARREFDIFCEMVEKEKGA